MNERRAISLNGSRRTVLWSVLVVCLLSVAAAGYVHWSDRAQSAASRPQAEPKATPVQVTLARTGTLPLVVEYRGELVGNAIELVAEGTGRIIALNKQLGDTVERGELLVRIDASESQRQLAEARAQVKATEADERRAQAEYKRAEQEAARGQRLLQEGILSAQEADTLASQVSVLQASIESIHAQRSAAQARAALFQVQVSQARILAPFDGAVAERFLDLGATVQPGTPILRLVDTGPLRVRFRASETHLARITKGVPFTLRTLATAEQVFHGKVERLSAEVSRVDRTIAVEGVVEDSAKLRPGMYATLQLRLGEIADRALIPTQAIATRYDDQGNETHSVYVVEGGTRAVRRPIQVLGTSGVEAAVSGIDAGATVISFGHDGLADSASVHVVEGPNKVEAP